MVVNKSRVLIIILFALWGLTTNLGATLARAGEPQRPLRVALLPIIDSLPFYVAKERGYFRELGLKVKAIPVASGLERDQLMQAGAIDGMLNEMITTANFNRNGIQVKTVWSVRKARSQSPMFRVLASPNSGIRRVGDLAGVPIGISLNTIIEYVTDRLLAAEGLKEDQIVKKSVPVIPERYQLLLQGQIKAATLPDPLAMSAIRAGAQAIVEDSSHPRYSVSVLSFHVGSLRKNPGAIRMFLKAWDRAVNDINKDPETFRSLMLKKIRVPKNVRHTYRIPPFPRREVPTPEQWADVMKWMQAKGLLKAPLPYQDSITAEYMP